MTPEEDGYPVIQVSMSWLDKNKPQIGGYLVIYQDGYTSYSPMAVFESGYARIEEKTFDVIQNIQLPPIKQIREQLDAIAESFNKTSNPMPLHQQRVLDEKAELDDKLHKLYMFYSSTIFCVLTESEKSLLLHQAVIMRTYSNILGDRIAEFK